MKFYVFDSYICNYSLKAFEVYSFWYKISLYCPSFSHYITEFKIHWSFRKFTHIVWHFMYFDLPHCTFYWLLVYPTVPYCSFLMTSTVPHCTPLYKALTSTEPHCSPLYIALTSTVHPPYPLYIKFERWNLSKYFQYDIFLDIQLYVALT